MFENLDELRNYIYVNFTPMSRDKAIQFYSEKAGVGIEEATLEVDKIYAKRQQDGMVLSTPKQWTPEGQKYEIGKRMFHFGIMLIILNTFLYIFGTIIFILTGQISDDKLFTMLFTTIIFFPNYIIGVILIFFGKRKMKKHIN